jgi:arylsulfatase
MRATKQAFFALTLTVLTVLSAMAQQTTGVPGSPSATTTIDGRYLPPPPPKFGGEIGLSAQDSKPYWPPQIVPPKGAPNILLIMTDDQGYGVSGTFGGVIPTPTMDHIAQIGLRYTQFHSTALCSPTRAALITGRNHHSVGFGVISEQSTGYPGYNSIIGPENATAYNAILDLPIAEQMKAYDAWGSAATYPHMAVAWAWAFDTPFKWTKQVASHYGGTRQGMVMSWPARIKDAGGIRTQWHHMIDIVPTILEATGIPAPVMVNGIGQKPIEGVSMGYTWDKATADAPSTRTTQYFEMWGNRAIYHNGWIAATTPPEPPWLLGTTKLPDVVNGYKWELYDVAHDYSEYNDLAARMPDKLREMQELFFVEGSKYNVFPLDNSVLQRALTPRPSATAGRNVFTYSGEISGIPDSDAPSILNRSYTITADVEVPQGGGEGMLVTLGGRFGGYGLYVLKGKPVFLYNFLDLERFRWEGEQALTPGKHTIVFDFTYNGPGFGKGGTGILKVDDRQVATKTIPHTVPIIMTLDETFDVGVDGRTPVDDNDYQIPFRFTGKLDKLTFKLGPEQLASEDRQVIQHALAAAHDDK